MAEEAIIDTGLEDSTPQPSAKEDLAREQGWRPLEEWDKDPEDWVDAKTFLRNGEYMDRIKSQSSTIKKLEKKLASQEDTVNELVQHHERVKEAEYQRGLKDLKALKKEAMELGDMDTVIDIDDKIMDLKQSNQAKPAKTQQSEETHPDVAEWMDRNPWYKEDPALQGAANGIISDILAKDPSMQGNIKEVLDRTSAKLKEEFPSKFGIRQRTPRVTEPSGSEPKLSAPKFTARHLNDQQKAVAKRFIAMGALKTMEEYAQQLGDIGGLDSQKGA